MKKNYLLVLGVWIGLYATSQTIIHRDASIESMVLMVSKDSLRSYINDMVSFGTRNTLSSQSDAHHGIGAARLWVLNKFNSFALNAGGRLSAIIDTTTLKADGRRIDKSLILGNVVATLKGNDLRDNRIFMISGHLDSRRTDVMDRAGDAPGANDDASGVAAVLECARILSAHSFPATVVFVAMSGEEQGLLGANYMANKAKKENWNIEAILNNDIMGSNNSTETNIINNTQIRVFSEAFSVTDTGKTFFTIRNLGLENDGKSRQLARYVKEIGERYIDHLVVKLIYRNDRFLRGGDHTPFVMNGFSAVRITEMNENYDHQHQDVRIENEVQYGDLIQFMDFDYLKKNTAMNLVTLANLAKAPAMPQDVKIEVRKLTNYTDLNWSEPKTGKVKGYYILIRETTSPFWDKKIFSYETVAHLPYSKDNYFFAVQSVGEEGNESLPVLPEVSRR